jgi:aminopeptidase YwaD
LGLSPRASFVATSLIAVVMVACALSANAQMVPAGGQRKANPSQSTLSEGASADSGLCATCIRHNLGYLAGPTLHGRGSGTIDEYHAAEFIARKLKRYGVAPAAENGRYIQTASLQSRKVTNAPVLSIDAGASSNPQPVSWTHGEEIAVLRLSEPSTQGPLQKVDLEDVGTSAGSLKDGAAVLLKVNPNIIMNDYRMMLGPYLESKAAIVIVPEVSSVKMLFERLSKEMPKVTEKMGKDASGPAVVFANVDAAHQLWVLPDGTSVKLRTGMTPWKTSHTWNVLGKIVGTSEKEQIVLLSAHLDHLGMRNGKTYPGADDDASGTVAVMELARALAAEPKPSRTVVFALWGSEEKGMVGSQYFLKNPTFELKNIVANLEFEMIARPDPKVERDQLWLSGWERTDLGPELGDHGANLVADPHPEQNFFARSDNYALAKQGIIAQTVSSYGLHKDYHQPTDTLTTVDWTHLDNAIASMIVPITWLANSDFVPKWNEGKKP